MSSSAQQKDDEISRLRKQLETLKARGRTGNKEERSTLGQVGVTQRKHTISNLKAMRRCMLPSDLSSNHYYKIFMRTS